MNSYIVDCLEPQPGLSPAHCAQTPTLTSMPRRVGAEPRYTFRCPSYVFVALRDGFRVQFRRRPGLAVSRGAGEGVADGGEDLVSVLFRGGGVAADGVPVAGGFLGAEPAGDLLLGLRWPDVAFGLVGQAGRQLRMVRVIRRPRAGCG